MVNRIPVLPLAITLSLVLVGFFSLISLPEEISPFDIVGPANGAFAGGTGTAGDPYQISNISQLQDMSYGLTAHYILINDIYANVTREWNDGRF